MLNKAVSALAVRMLAASLRRQGRGPSASRDLSQDEQAVGADGARLLQARLQRELARCGLLGAAGVCERS